jgi:hypothetical protein
MMLQDAMIQPSETDISALARDIAEVHGKQAAAVARENARTAALAGQPARAKFWISVLGMIQRQDAAEVSAIQSVADDERADDER